MARSACATCAYRAAADAGLREQCDPLLRSRGKMRKKVWVGAGDIIMVSLRDYQVRRISLWRQVGGEARTGASAAGR